MALLGLSPAYWVVLGHAAAAVLLGAAFFRRYRVARPPVGVFDLGDVALLLGAVVLAPLLYLALPRWAAAGLLGLGVLGALLVVLEPVLGAGRGARGRWAPGSPGRSRSRSWRPTPRRPSSPARRPPPRSPSTTPCWCWPWWG